MSKIVSVHSFRGGTGKSNTTASVASLLAARVAVVDKDIRPPGIHILFNLDKVEMVHSLIDELWRKCGIKDAAHDVTGRLGTEVKGQVFLIPARIRAGQIARIMRVGATPACSTADFATL